MVMELYTAMSWIHDETQSIVGWSTCIGVIILFFPVKDEQVYSVINILHGVFMILTVTA